VGSVNRPIYTSHDGVLDTVGHPACHCAVVVVVVCIRTKSSLDASRHDSVSMPSSPGEASRMYTGLMATLRRQDGKKRQGFSRATKWGQTRMWTPRDRDESPGTFVARPSASRLVRLRWRWKLAGESETEASYQAQPDWALARGGPDPFVLHGFPRSFSFGYMFPPTSAIIPTTGASRRARHVRDAVEASLLR